mmetsp:Transcript_24350/g.62793  ORF Transcript_24350/g.62793 Transcript_24350/m.62793 type:complete len:277 (-) Transcript_24350:139-969(-)
MHLSWKQWPHGSWHASVPTMKSSRHTAHVECACLHVTCTSTCARGDASSSARSAAPASCGIIAAGTCTSAASPLESAMVNGHLPPSLCTTSAARARTRCAAATLSAKDGPPRSRRTIRPPSSAALPSGSAPSAGSHAHTKPATPYAIALSCPPNAAAVPRTTRAGSVRSFRMRDTAAVAAASSSSASTASSPSASTHARISANGSILTRGSASITSGGTRSDEAASAPAVSTPFARNASARWVSSASMLRSSTSVYSPVIGSSTPAHDGHEPSPSV